MMFKLCVVPVFVLIQLTFGQKYKIPNILVELLSPKGLRFSIPDSPGIEMFVVQGHVTKSEKSYISKNALNGEVTSSKNGRWVYESFVGVVPGDVIKYNVFVLLNGSGYRKDNLRYVVPGYFNNSPQMLLELTDSGHPGFRWKKDFTETTSTSMPTSTGECLIGVTTVQNRAVCIGKTILYETFDTLSTDAWQIEQKIAFDHPEYPFISYQRSAVFVKNGLLFIEPSLQQDKPSFNEESIYAGKLDLVPWCTGQPITCQMTASGINILPPVVTGKITIKALSFRYGVVEIRAMMPQGDWLYPEIILEPFSYQYGTAEYASGLFKIASARGNSELNSAGSEIGNQVLYGGPIIEKECLDALIVTKKENNKKWGDMFHTYTMRWKPESIVLSVDNEEWATFTTNKTLVDLLPPFCKNYARIFANESKMAPFDKEFVLSLGLAAGGITEFPDSTRSKPWRNSASKAKLHFWQHLNNWYPTWGENSAFVIDYVKITAV